MNKVIMFLPDKVEARRYAYLLVTDTEVYFGVMHTLPKYGHNSKTAQRVKDLLGQRITVETFFIGTSRIIEANPKSNLLNYTLGKSRRLTSNRVPSNRAVRKLVGRILTSHKMGFTTAPIMKYVKLYVNKASAAE